MSMRQTAKARGTMSKGESLSIDVLPPSGPPNVEGPKEQSPHRDLLSRLMAQKGTKYGNGKTPIKPLPLSSHGPSSSVASAPPSLAPVAEDGLHSEDASVVIYA